METSTPAPDNRKPRGPDKQSGYPEPQPEDAGEARHGGKDREQGREDGGMRRDPDGDSGDGPQDH